LYWLLSIGIGIANTLWKKVLVLVLAILFKSKYWYWYWQYFQKVLLTTLVASIAILVL